MHLPAFLTLGALATTLRAVPADQPTVQVAHLTFRGVDDQPVYKLAVKADGAEVASGDTKTVISKIDAPDYNAYSQCTFRTHDKMTKNFTMHPDGKTQQVEIVPSMPILGVTCEGMCVSKLNACYKNGQMVGLCCNGFCMANLCRPWDLGQQPPDLARKH